MKDIEKHFERFVDFLETEVEAKRPVPDFREICLSLGAPEAELDSYLSDHFGLGGADIVRSYRTSTPVSFL